LASGQCSRRSGLRAKPAAGLEDVPRELDHLLGKRGAVGFEEEHRHVGQRGEGAFDARANYVPYQLAAMAELPLAAVVVEGRYPKLFELPRVRDGWLPDVLARLQIRYREIPIVFADSRKFAEEWTYRFLATALADLGAASDLRAKVST
jgi:hypothetical protein